MNKSVDCDHRERSQSPGNGGCKVGKSLRCHYLATLRFSPGNASRGAPMAMPFHYSRYGNQNDLLIIANQLP